MIKNQEKSEELIRAEKLIDDGKYDNALYVAWSIVPLVVKRK